MYRAVLLVFFCLMTTILKANDGSFILTPQQMNLIVEFQENIEVNQSDSLVVIPVKFKRGKAILFTILTGFLGGHRIYFGTHHRTPIIYSITFGGLGILPIIDLVHIIFTKDLSIYQDNSQFIMWGK